MAREAKVVANAKTKRSKHARDVVTRITLQQIALTLTKRAENVERLAICQVRVDLLDHRSLNRRVAARRAREAKVHARPKRAGLVASPDISHSSAPRRMSTQLKSRPQEAKLVVKRLPS